MSKAKSKAKSNVKSNVKSNAKSNVMSVRARFLQKQYQMGKLDNESLKQFVAVGQITAEEYKTITGIEYVAA